MKFIRTSLAAIAFAAIASLGLQVGVATLETVAYSQASSVFQARDLAVIKAIAKTLETASPMSSAHAGALTDYAENKIVDALFRGQSLGAPATWHFALYTACPTESSAGTEVTGGGYARVPVAASLANFAGTQSAGSTTASSGTGGTTSNNSTVTFPTASGSWGTINCWGLTDALTAGNIWVYTTVTIPPTITSGATPSFSPGTATIQIDN